MTGPHSPQQGGMDEELGRLVGIRLRLMRRGRGMTLRDLAARAGVSYGFLGQIEAGHARPSMRTLGRLADAFGVPASTLLEDTGDAGTRSSMLDALGTIEQLIDVPLSTSLARSRPQGVAADGLGWASPDGTTRVIRRHQRRTITWPSTSGRAYLLTPDFDRALEVTVNEYDPGRQPTDRVHAHEGEAFGLVLEGRCLVQVGPETYLLDPGDAIYLSCTEPHLSGVSGTTRGVMLWVTTPPAARVVEPAD